MKISVMDFETDPFKSGRIPEAFLSGYYDGERFISVWDETNCVTRTLANLETEEPQCIFLHNGGKFDFHLGLIDHFTGNIRIINGRVVSAHYNQHEFRDSFAILPFPLREYMKDDIDYSKLERDERDKHREEIISYLRTDCVKLHELVTAFIAEFGDKLTVGSSSMKQLTKFHEFSRTSVLFDMEIRDKYFFGGRCEVLAPRPGVIEQPIKIYDVNSMYPYVMRDCLHPVGSRIVESNKIEKNTCFLTIEGESDGAFPTRQVDGSLEFRHGYGTYHTSIHEYNCAVDTGTFRPKRIHKTLGVEKRISFDKFVSHFFAVRKEAKLAGNRIHDILYKYVLNSSYGKFGQNPENYFDWQITTIDAETPNDICEHCYGHKICRDNCFWCTRVRNSHPTFVANGKRHKRDATTCATCDGSGYRWSQAERANRYIIWQARLRQQHFYNVATGASITGAARAVLLRGIHSAVNPLYCDTDSIICESLDARLDDSDLGAWKLEATGDIAAIARKKLYAIFTYTYPGPDKKGIEPEQIQWRGRRAWLVKKAHKGARITGAEIMRICQGDTITYESAAPSYKLNGKHQFVKRRIRMVTPV